MNGIHAVCPLYCIIGNTIQMCYNHVLCTVYTYVHL